MQSQFHATKKICLQYIVKNDIGQRNGAFVVLVLKVEEVAGIVSSYP